MRHISQIEKMGPPKSSHYTPVAIIGYILLVGLAAALVYGGSLYLKHLGF